MKKLRLQTKFLIINIISILCSLHLGIEAYMALNNLTAASEASDTANLLIRNHLEGDMMHDAIRADVFKATIAYNKQDGASLKETMTEMKEHGDNFSDMVGANLKLTLPDEMHALIVDIAPKLEEYKKKAQIAVDHLSSPDFDKYNQEFLASFSQLEDAQSELSDKIQAWSGQIKNESVSTARTANDMILLVSAISLLITIMIPILMHYWLFSPQRELINEMDHLAHGRLDEQIQYSDRKNEIGDIARSIIVFQRNARDKVKLEQDQAQQKLVAEEEKKKALHTMATQFENSVKRVVQAVTTTAAMLSTTSNTIFQEVDSVNHKAVNVSSASGQTLSNVQAVASAAEEMSASVREISTQVQKTSVVVEQAVKNTHQADVTAKQLSEVSQAVGGIITMIENITDQINLLALNATIEAARAGDAGKGFAVVASEVKSLAQQTAKATHEIALQINGVKDATSQVSSVLSEIRNSVGSVSEYAGNIASAVEQQSAVTNEIAKNMHSAAGGVATITGDITDVSNISGSAKVASQKLLDASKMLSGQAESLNKEVDAFLGQIKAA